MAWGEYLKPLLSTGGKMAGNLLGGPLGEFAGSALGSLTGSGIGSYLSGSSAPQQQVMNYPQSTPMGNMGNMQQVPGGATMMQTPRFAPDQMSALQQLLSSSLGGMEQLPSADFGKIEDLYTKQFHEDIVPSIMERFSGMGAGSQRSSAFQSALGGAGAGLAQNLAGMRQQFNMAQRGQESSRLMNMLQMALQPQFQTDVIQPRPSAWGMFGGQLAESAGKMLPLLLQSYLFPQQQQQ